MTTGQFATAEELPVMVVTVDGKPVEFVDLRTYERVTSYLENRLRETTEFGRAHGLTDQMWATWKEDA